MHSSLIVLFTRSNCSHDQAVLAPFGDRAILLRRRELHGDEVPFEGLAVDRSPGRPLVAELVELGQDLLLSHPIGRAHDAESLQALEREVGAHFAVQLEAESVVLAELHVVRMWLRDEFELLLREGGVVSCPAAGDARNARWKYPRVGHVFGRRASRRRHTSALVRVR